LHVFDTATTTDVNVNTYPTAAFLWSVIGRGSGFCKEFSACKDAEKRMQQVQTNSFERLKKIMSCFPKLWGASV
jgi:hypothetical protein